MLKKIAPCGAAVLISAAFTFVAAQFPWETSGSQPPPESTAPSFSSDDSPYSFGSSGSSGETASGSEEAEKKETPGKDNAVSSKQPKAASSGQSGARRERASKDPGFSAAFEGPQKTCPVCASKRLKNNLFVDYNGKDIHVCSAACIGRVKRNPAPFAQKLEKRGEKIGK